MQPSLPGFFVEPNYHIIQIQKKIKGDLRDGKTLLDSIGPQIHKIKKVAIRK